MLAALIFDASFDDRSFPTPDSAFPGVPDIADPDEALLVLPLDEEITQPAGPGEGDPNGLELGCCGPVEGLPEASTDLDEVRMAKWIHGMPPRTT